MLLKGPGQAAYQTVTASSTVQIPAATDATGPYQSFANVTSIVSAAGPGTWFGANVAAATGADRYGGWTLVVAYRNPGLPLRDLTVFNGFDNIGGTNSDTITISGFLAPFTGPVRTTVGIVAYEGDSGITGDTFKLNSTALTTAVRPANNFFDSAISNLGVNVTARNPPGSNATTQGSYADNFGFDISTADATGVIGNGATSATATFTTSGDQYYPGVLTTAIDLFAPSFPPVTKTVVDLSGHNPAQVGDKLEYTVDETNTGGDPAVGTQIQDQVPPNTTYVPNSLAVVIGAGAGAKTDQSGDDTAEFNASSTAVFRVGTGATATQGGTLNPGDETAVRFDVTVNPAAAGTTINNAATLLYTAKTLAKAFNLQSNFVSTPVAASADVSITKTAANPTPPAGGPETYTLTVNNAGPSPAAAVTVTDSLSAGTTLVSATASVGSCTAGSGQVSCSLGTLAASATATVTVTVSLASGLAAGGLTNVAQVSSATADPNLANNTATATVQVIAVADVSVTKTLQTNPVVPGNPVTYLLTATNNGPSDAAGVVVTDVPDNNLAVTAAVPSVGSCNLNAGEPVCSIGALAAGASATVTVTASLPPSITGSITNQALVSTTTPDPNPADDQASVTSPVTPEADLSVTKTVSPNPIVPGAPAVYSLVVTNNGPSRAASALLADTPPAGEQFVSFATTQGDCSSLSPLTCNLGPVAAGATVRVDVTASIDPSATGNLTNSATVSSSTADPNPANNTGTTTTPLTPSADLDIDKTGTDPIVDGGANSYMLTVTNNGPSTATAVAINDPLPADLSGVTASSTGGPCTVAAGAVSCTATQLTVGATDVVSIGATLAASHTGNLVNTATVTSATADPDSANNTATFTSGTGPEADLSLTKTASSLSVTAGSSTTYTLTAFNNGPSNATGVAITDNLPTGVTLTSAPGCTLAGSVLTCPVGALAAGSQAVETVVVTLGPGYPGTTLSNSASVTSTSPPEGSTSNNTDTVTQDVTQSADLSMTKTAPATAAAGNQITYKLVARNAGPSDAQGVVASDLLPSGLTFVSGAGCTSTVNGSVTCAVGNLPAGQSATFSITASTDPSLAPGTLINTAQVGSLTPDPDNANDTSSASTNITTAADLSVTKSVVPDPLAAGGPAAYTVIIHNAGPSDAQGVTLTDPIPAGVTIVDASTTGGSCSLIAGVGTCDLGTIPAGATFTVSADVVTDPGTTGSVTNTANVTSTTPDPNLANDSSTINTPVVQSADVSVQKTASPEQPVPAGSAISWALLVVNAGPSVATGVTVTDPLPEGTSLASGSPGCAGVTTVSCLIGTLAVGGSTTLVVDATTASNLASGSSIANTATVTSSTPDPVLSNNNSTATSTITTAADLVAAKTSESAQATAGGQLVYDMVVSSNGPSDAQNSSLTDPLPPGTTFVSATTDTGTCSSNSGVLTCAFGTLPAGDAANVKLTVLLASSLAVQTTLTNTTTVTSTTPDPNPANATASATTAVVRSNDLALTKTASPDPAVAGSELTYTLTVTNNGPSDSSDSTITDPLPAGTTYVGSSPATACTLGSDSVTVACDAGPIAAGAQSVVTITVLVGATVAAGTDLVNTAMVTGVDEDPNPANNSATATTGTTSPPPPPAPPSPPPPAPPPPPPPTSADLSMTKTGPSSVVAGTAATYNMTVTNSGPTEADNVALSDPLPTGTTFVSVTSSAGTCSGGGTVACLIGTLADGATATVTVVVDVPASFLPGPLTNTATASSSTPDPNSANDTATTTAQVTDSSDVALSKDGPAATVAGNAITWTVTVKNLGPSDAEQVTTIDALPVGVTFEAATSPCTESAGSVSCRYPSLAAGQDRVVKITGAVGQDVTGPDMTNTATVTSATTDPDPDNNRASATTVLGAEADLAITKTVTPQPPVPGDPLRFTLTVRDNGPSTALDTVVTDPVNPAVLSPIATTSAGACTLRSGVVTCDLGALEPGTTPVAITVSGTLDASFTGALSNTATVTSATPDPDLANDAATLTAPVATAADVTLTKSASPAAAAPGAPVTFTLKVTNRGPSDAHDVVITDVLVPQLVFSSASPGCTFASATATIECEQDTVTAGETVTFTITATVKTGTQAGPLVNQAVTAADGYDPDLANNGSSTTIAVVESADLVAAKTVDKSAASVGDILAYTVTVSDKGPSAATGVQATDLLPASLLLVAATPSTGTYDAAGGTWTIGTLPSGGDAVMTVRAKAVATAAGTTVVNEVSGARADQPDPDPANNTAEAKTVVSESADLALVKSAAPSPVDAGRPLTYTLVVTNAGPSAAQKVSLRDPLPVGVTPKSATTSLGTCTTGTTVNCALGSLASGAKATVKVVVAVNPSLAATGLTNTATVTSATGDPNPLNNTASVTTSVEDSADLSLVKHGPSTALAGNKVSYTLRVSNAGPSAAQGVVVRDPLPAGATLVSASPSKGSCRGSPVVMCDLGDLGEGASATIVLVVGLQPGTAGKTLTNNATVSATTPDANPGNNTGSTNSAVAPKVAPETTVTGPSMVVAGQPITWTVTIYNPSPYTTTGDVVSDPLPGGVTYRSSSSACTFANGIVTCDLAPLPPHSRAVMALTGTVKPAFSAPSVTDSAHVSSSTQAASSTATVTHEAGLHAAKTVSKQTAEVGGTLVYTVTVTNVGPSDATGVEATDHLPGGLKLTTAGATSGSYDSTTGLWAIGKLGASNTAILTIDAVIEGSAAGQTVTNHVDISRSDQPDPDTANRSAAASTTVAASTHHSAPAPSSPPPSSPQTSSPQPSSPQTSSPPPASPKAGNSTSNTSNSSQPSPVLATTGIYAMTLVLVAIFLIASGSAIVVVARTGRPRLRPKGR